MRKLIITLVMLVLTACNDSDGHKGGDTDKASITAFQGLWQQQTIESYSFVYRATGYFINNGQGERITVYNGRVVDVEPVENSTSVFTRENAPTIDELFEQILQCDSEGCVISRVEFDSEYFFPTLLSAQNPSEGWGFEISGFNQLPASKAELDQALLDNKTKWQSQNIVRYQQTTSMLYFWQPEQNQRMNTVVENGVVELVSYAVDGSDVPASVAAEQQSIEQRFVFIQALIDDESLDYVIYDQALGYPKEISTGAEYAAVDGQFIWRVEDVELLDYTTMYISKGDSQCHDDGLTKSEVSSTLQTSDINYKNSQCGQLTGVSYAAVCGGGTGNIYLFDVESSQLMDAENIGFTNISQLADNNIGYQISPCENELAKEWLLISYGEQASNYDVTVNGAEYDLNFDPINGTISTWDTCNDIGGNYQFENNKLVFTDILTTEKYCGDRGDSINQQEDFIHAIFFQSNQANVLLSGDTLTITANNGKYLVYQAK